MSATLEDRVAAYVADHPNETAFTIARAVRGRDKTVAEILSGPLFARSRLNRWASDKAVGYSLAVSGPGQRREGRKRRSGTHKQRVLDLLSDGRPHSHMEGYRLGVMLHSRVADLRRDGYRIECWRDGDDYLYRLLDGAAGQFGGADGSAASSSGRPPQATHPAAPSQLELLPATHERREYAA